jgi:NDP-sugar pyrophosphorylase family protein
MTSTAPTLLVLAAGLGSRYGGLKQLDPVGPSGETILDYSIYDAIRAGYAKVVFVIRKQNEAAFRETAGARWSGHIAVEYAFQELDTTKSGRTKPWGTAHAVLAAADSVQTPFAVINADDFYGAQSLRLLSEHFSAGLGDYAMVAYPLRNTLSPFGTVSRGICEVDQGGYLRAIVERTHIAADGSSTGDELVSMNLWGFTPSLFPELRLYFARFLAGHANDLTAEAYLPTFVDELIAAGRARVRVLQTPDAWLGMTYREDLPRVAAGIRALIAAGVYPERLA